MEFSLPPSRLRAPIGGVRELVSYTRRMSLSRAMDSHKPYLERVAQLIPGEFVSAHLFIQGMVYNHITLRDFFIELSAVFLFLLLPFYLWKLRGVTTLKQILLTMGSFVVWVLAVSLPVHQRSGLDPLVGSIILPLWTLLVPVLAAPSAAASSPAAADEAASGASQER